MKFKLSPCTSHGKRAWHLLQTDYDSGDGRLLPRTIDVFESVSEARAAAVHLQEPPQEFEL